MFWNGNYIAVRELNFLLKEENVTLSQVLEADDILQECKADNKALMMFLTRPDILSELITLITEEPSKDLELSNQYRHANIACEVLTSDLSMLSDRLSLDLVQMNRLCDFVNRDPPLNPLLASYFSRTVKMLLERSPKQDWYLYHIVCLRVLDFFKTRRDFLPNLLRHMATSAIADVFKCFIRLDDLFNKIVIEWLEEHQFLESLIQMTCGAQEAAGALHAEKGAAEPSEKPPPPCDPDEALRRRRRAAVAADNAGALLLELAWGGGAAEAAGGGTARALAARLGGADTLRLLLGGAATAPAAARPRAQALAATLLQALVRVGAEREAVELAVAPHLPLLHRALLAEGEGEGAGRVGAARLAVAQLVALLASSQVYDVCTTLLTLGTPGVMLDMFERYPNNNFLHATVVSLVSNALNNEKFKVQYAQHFFIECDLLTRLMDLFETNHDKVSGARQASSGHVSRCCAACAEALGGAGAGAGEGEAGAGAAGAGAALVGAVPAGVLARWQVFTDERLAPALQRLQVPLGGLFPSENFYEVGNMGETLVPDYDFSYLTSNTNMEDIGEDIAGENESELPDGHGDSAEFIADGFGLDDSEEKEAAAKSSFLELASQRFEEMWEDAPEPEESATVAEVLNEFSPWDSECGGSGGSGGAGEGEGEGWAQFEAAGGAPPVDPFAPPAAFREQPFEAYWPYRPDQNVEDLSSRLSGLELASNLLTAMSNMSPAALSSLQASLAAPDRPAADVALTDEASPAVTSDVSDATKAKTANVPTTEPKIADVPPSDVKEADVPSEAKSTVVLACDGKVADVPGSDVKTCDAGPKPDVETSDADSKVVNEIKTDDTQTKVEIKVEKSSSVTESMSDTGKSGETSGEVASDVDGNVGGESTASDAAADESER